MKATSTRRVLNQRMLRAGERTLQRHQPPHTLLYWRVRTEEAHQTLRLERIADVHVRRLRMRGCRLNAVAIGVQALESVR